MRQRVQQVACKGHEDLVPGVFIEVLWDIEEVNREGRRRGERIVTSIWWRAENMTVQVFDVKCKVQLRYDSRDGFRQQLGDVWMFPKHVRLVGDDSTQLRWRDYECSGDVKYDVEDEMDMEVDQQTCIEDCAGTTSKRLMQMEEKLVGDGSKGDRACAQLFATLRQKVAVLMQKPVPGMKARKDSDDVATLFYEDSCAGCVSADVDCDFELFETVARVVKSKVASACFRPSLRTLQSVNPSLEMSEITFSSFSDLTAAIGITSLPDVMRMALREKGNCRELRNPSLDVSIRIVGTCLMDSDNEKSPTALLVCKSIHESSLVNVVHSFVRETREFDFTSGAYRHPFQAKKLNGKSLLRSVFASRFVGMSETTEMNMFREIFSDIRTFTLRWRASTTPSSRMWTRSLAVSEFVTGTLEIEIPFLIFRGPEAVTELMDIITGSFIARQLSEEEDGSGEVAVSGT